MAYDDPNVIESILRTCSTIAVVGASSKPSRPSYHVFEYMKSHGYSVIPINPHETMILGEEVFPSMEAVGTPIDLVDIFRRPEEVLSVVRMAITRKAKAVWMQEGVINQAAASLAVSAGLMVVMNRCWMKEHFARSVRG
ncbi:CoA-binding protein [Nitrospira sp. KM1]|uniref:CoA-binding protein n=1 Tax=Nitrospira sp. KM1 TaxID=1936990 RepID=UPI0013A71F27|nr:CoA-binding protein [Nitrospira sp. KM1]BCA53386.1 CoA-binding protein [Nitrospira sp. KM1]